jgi:integrase
MATKKALQRFTGIYYTESKVKRWRERPDRCYWINFKRNGKLVWERCGWASEGWTPEAAQRKRYEILDQDRVGAYKPSRERKEDLLTFGELMEKHYLPWADANKKRARDDRSLYRCWVGPRLREKPMSAITPLNIERLKKDMRDAGRAEASIKHALCLIRQAFNKAHEWKLWSGENPCHQVKFPRPNNARQRFLSPREAEMLLAALADTSQQLYRISAISLYTGMRLREVLDIRWSNVDFDNKIISILDTKNGDARQVFITDPVERILSEMGPGEPSELIFRNKFGDKVGWLSKAFKKTVDSIGLNDGIVDPRQKVSFHTLRHTFCSWSVMSGTPLYLVGKAVGHRTASMTMRYSHLSPESQRRAFEAAARFPLNADIERAGSNVR